MRTVGVGDGDYTLSRNDLATRPSGHAGPPVATPGAQCPGRHEFTIAFEPRGKQPAAARLLSSARALIAPPRVVVARSSGGNAPTRRSFLTLDRHAGDVVLSALKKADDRDSVIVRLFNPGDEDAHVTIAGLKGPRYTDDGTAAITQAFAVNFLEERQQELEVAAGAVRVRLGPHQIQTIELRP